MARKIDPNKKAKQTREGRLVIVAELYKKGYSYDRIRKEVMHRTGVTTYSKSTVSKDVHILLSEWRERRIADVDLLVQLELEKINDQEVELWEAWEKSKQDHKLTSKKQKGKAAKGKGVNEKGNITDTDTIVTTDLERTEKQEINFGDPRYQDALNRVGQERRKLLGLYAPEKRELSGNLGFYDFLIDSNTIDGNETE